MARVAMFNGSAHTCPWARKEPSHVAFRAAPGEHAVCLPYLEVNNILRLKLPHTQPVKLMRPTISTIERNKTLASCAHLRPCYLCEVWWAWLATPASSKRNDSVVKWKGIEQGTRKPIRVKTIKVHYTCVWKHYNENYYFLQHILIKQMDKRGDKVYPLNPLNKSDNQEEKYSLLKILEFLRSNWTKWNNKRATFFIISSLLKILSILYQS